MSNAGVIIAGAAETDEIGRLPNTSTLGLHVEAARNAVADAGLTMKDIDGIATVSAPGPVQVAHALGIYPDWVDGGGALVVTSAERAPDFPKPPVHVLGTGEASETPMISQMIDFTESQMFRQAGQKAFAEAGITTACGGLVLGKNPR
jgi:3-oxoacyl-[acyl-carrier-protein] synthase III